MNHITVGYTLISVIFAILDLALAWYALGRRTEVGKHLSVMALAAAGVDIFYLCSILDERQLSASYFSSLYFICMDCMLAGLLLFALSYTGAKPENKRRPVLLLVYVYIFLEVLLFLSNPYTGWVIGYELRDSVIAHYAYDMHALYFCHLAFCYALLAAALVILAGKGLKAPRLYRLPYTLSFLSIFSLAVVNMVFLIFSGDETLRMIDVSVCGYSLVLMLLCWNAFSYRKNTMLKNYSRTVFDNVDQGIFMFDYEDRLLMCNARAENLFKGKTFPEGMELAEFSRQVFGGERTFDDSEDVSFFCRKRDEKDRDSLRCDLRQLTDEEDRFNGRLFVFTDLTLESDLLTGLKSFDSLKRLTLPEHSKEAAEAGETFSGKYLVCVLDVNGLSLTNGFDGYSEGDEILKDLAAQLRRIFPGNAFLSRGPEASLVVICRDMSEAEAEKHLAGLKVKEKVSFQYGLSEKEEGEDLLPALSRAKEAMHVKKLLDPRSVHSQSLASLVCALQETDPDTEAHVKRTQKMGDLLGRRLGLNDAQRADLSLMCLLHDIGKIGIPLEILNKPGRLTKEEWEVIRTHAEKGYQIAMSSRDLKRIALCIRYHHERWDGKGYPIGLEGEDIPLLSRIISVVDAYDAMVNDRSYRRGLSREAALGELARGAGTQFDPKIVEMFSTIPEEELPRPSVSGEENKNALPPAGQGKAVYSASVRPVLYSRYILNHKEEICAADEVFLQLTGYTPEEAEGRRLKQQDLIPEEDRPAYTGLCMEMIAKNHTAYIEHRLVKKDGSLIRVYCWGRKYYDSAAREERAEIIITPVREIGTQVQSLA